VRRVAVRGRLGADVAAAVQHLRWQVFRDGAYYARTRTTTSPTPTPESSHRRSSRRPCGPGTRPAASTTPCARPGRRLRNGALPLTRRPRTTCWPYNRVGHPLDHRHVRWGFFSASALHDIATERRAIACRVRDPNPADGRRTRLARQRRASRSTRPMAGHVPRQLRGFTTRPHPLRRGLRGLAMRASRSRTRTRGTQRRQEALSNDLQSGSRLFGAPQRDSRRDLDADGHQRHPVVIPPHWLDEHQRPVRNTYPTATHAADHLAHQLGLWHDLGHDLGHDPPTTPDG